MNQNHQVESGIVLISTLLMLAALLALFAAFYSITRIEFATTRASKNSASGFAVAEAGLNLRAEEIRATFLDYNRPTGIAPVNNLACQGTNQGSGDFTCQDFEFGKHIATTYVSEDSNNPIQTTVPSGELYQNLAAQEYRYSIRSTAKNPQSEVEALLELRFKSRLIPLFQFVAFYDKDLEILPGPDMTLSGPIHTNGDLYLDTNSSLNIGGQVTVAGDLFRGRKDDSSCNKKTVAVKDPANYLSIMPNCNSRTQVQSSDLPPWNGMIRVGVEPLTVPQPEMLDSTPGSAYWDKADLRLALHLDSSNNPDLSFSSLAIEVRNTDNSVNTSATTFLEACPGLIDAAHAVGNSYSFFNNRETKFIKMLEVDLQGLLDCIHSSNLAGGLSALMNGKALNEESEGGLVLYLAVDGPDSYSIANSYGVRLRNAAELQSSLPSAPLVKGITVVTNQAIYSAGDYNIQNKIPAALMADSFNVLSNNWNFSDVPSTNAIGQRQATNTAINAAILAGTDSTGGVDGSNGRGVGKYNGGLENYPRFHENWSSKTLTYRGSFVSLGTPLHVDGEWKYGGPQYTAPNRNWDYDTDFNDAANLPPMTPRFVYLRQELFVREFEQ